MALGGLKNFFGLGAGPKSNFTSGQELNRIEDLYNRYNINSPFGSRTFTKDAEGRAVLNINETPEQKRIRELQQSIGMNTLGSQAPTLEDFASRGRATQDAIYQSALMQLRPELDRQNSRLQQDLANRGIGLGNVAYTRANQDLARNTGEQLNQLSLQALLASYQQQAQDLQLAEQQRAYRLAEAGGALAGINTSLFGNVANINAANNITQQEGAQNAYNISRFQDMQARRNATINESMKGGANAITAALASSDINLKENIKNIGKKNGFNIYEFNYIGNPDKYIGVMAQEVQEIMPDAVVEKDGFLAVDYGKIGVNFIKL